MIMVPYAALGMGFLWRCQWRVEWKSVHEYWYRSQLGPFYLLHGRQP
jgi:hypothetical protein